MRKKVPVVGAFLAVFLLAGCGGGGGGGGSESLYTGVTSPAVIDNTNAVDIASGAYYGGEMVDTSFLPGVLAAEGNGSAVSPPFQIFSLVRTFQDIADGIGVQPQTAGTMGLARPLDMSASGRIPEGAVDNYMDFSFSWNEETGSLSGTFSFHNFGDDEGNVLNGSVGISGTTSISYNPDPVPGDILEVTFHFSSFTSSDGVNAVKISGSMTLASDGGTGNGSATIVLYVTDLVTGTTNWINHYTITTTGGADGIGAYTEATISAGSSICFQDHGCVDVETTTPFRQYDMYTFPSSGVLVVTGDGNRSARFNVSNDPAGYFVDADLDADGTYEWQSDIFPWV